MNLPLFPPDDLFKPPPLVKALQEAHPGRFATAKAARRYISLIWFPPSRAWRYQLNGKSGNTFVLNLLFELEYRVPFRCNANPAETGNQHPDFALFSVPHAQLWSNSVKQEDDLDAVLDFPGLSLATVRNPYTRLVSGFFYLCRSHELSDRRFLPERIRLNALTGMDWDKEANTPAGFERFLNYIRDISENFGPEDLDAHWLPQALHIRPDIYKPDLVGRTEDLPKFAKDLCKQLDRPQPKSLAGLRRNASKRIDHDAFLSDPALRRIIEEVYASDFELFDYPLI